MVRPIRTHLRVAPPPVADSLSALLAATDGRERRDRVVETYRAISRVVATPALAARLQFGPGPGGPTPRAESLLQTLGRRGLTDGQWLELTRELLKPWGDAHPVPGLTEAFFDPRFARASDGLLKMRRSETVAHGPSGDSAQIAEVLDRRLPQLVALLEVLAPWFATVSWAVRDASGALRLEGPTPPGGRWPRFSDGSATGISDGPLHVPFLVCDDRPCTDLGPVTRFAPPCPGAPAELFLLEGPRRRGAAFVSLPAMAELVEADGLEALGAAISPEEPTAPEGRPFRGLAGFGPEHADRFFGRDVEITALANRVRVNPLVTVTGASGSGKSSLVAAGVVPALSAGVLTLRPGFDPLSVLAREATLLTRDPHVGDLARSDPTGFCRALESWCTNAEVPWLVLLVDQAEELVTLSADPERRARFLDAVLACAADRHGPLRVVLTVREDFFVRLASIAGLGQRVDRAVEVVVRPERDALMATLVEPARAWGYTFEDFDLVAEMVDAVDGEAAALPLLQFCADRMWDVRDRSFQRLTRASYEAVGGVTGALALHAEETFLGLPAEARSTGREVLLRLVTPERTRTLVPRASLRLAGADAVVEDLVAARLLSVRQGEDGPLVEVVHEALFTQWDRLARWLDEDREGQRLRHALTAATREWEARARAEGLLWRGDALVEARMQRARTGVALPPAEQDFLDASLARDARTRTRTLAAVALILAGSLTATAVVTWQWRTTVAAEREAVEAKAVTEAALQDAQRKRQEALMAAAGAAGDTLAELAHARALLATEPDGGRRRELAVRITSLELEGAAVRVLEGHGHPGWSPDGKVLVTRSAAGLERVDPATGTSTLWWEGALAGRPAVGDTGVWLWDREKGLVRLPWEGEPQVLGKDGVGELRDGFVWLHAAGPFLLVSSLDRWAQYDVRDLDAVERAPQDEGHIVLAAEAPLSPHGDRLYRDALFRREVGAFVPLPAARSGVWSRDGERFATSDLDARVSVFDRDGRELWSRRGFAGIAGFSPDGERLSLFGAAGIEVHDVPTGAALWSAPTAPDMPLPVFTTDGRFLLTGGRNPTLRDADTGRIVANWRGRHPSMRWVRPHPGDASWAAGDLDRTVVFDSIPARTGPSGTADAAASVMCSLDAGLTVSAADGRTLYRDSGPCRSWVGTRAGDIVLSIRNRDARTFRVHVFDVANGKELGVSPPDLTQPGTWTSRTWAAAAGLAISPSGEALTAWQPGADGFAWKRPAAIAAVALGDGSRLLARSEVPDATTVLDARTGDALLSLQTPHAWWDARDSENGRFVAASGDEWAMVWDLESPDAPPREVRLEQPSVMAYTRGSTLAVSDDGDLLAIRESRAEGAVSLYDVTSGGRIGRIEPAENGLGFEGRTVLAAMAEGGSASLTPPSIDPEVVLTRSGAATNARVCRETFEITLVLPYPDADDVWTDCVGVRPRTP